MFKTMDAGPAAPQASDAKTAGASFLEVLAGTSALASALPGAAVAPVSGQTSSAGSDATDQGNQATPQSMQQSASQPASDAANQSPVQPSLPQVPVTPAPVAPNLLVSQLASALASSKTNVAGKPADKSNASAGTDGQKEQAQTPAVTTAPVAVPVIPSPQPNTIALLQIPTVPSPAADAPSTLATPITTDAGNARTAASSSQPLTALAGASDGKAASLSGTLSNVPVTSAADILANTQADLVAHGESPILDKPQAQAAKTGDAKSNAGADAKAQTADATASTQASITPAGSSNAPAALAAFVLPNDLILPGTSLPPSSGNVSQVVAKPAQAGKTTDATLNKLPDTAMVADPKKSNDASADATSTNTSSSSSAANNHQTAQQAQADPSQPAPVGAKTSDAGATQIAAQIQAIATRDGAHDTATAPSSHADGAPATAHGGDQMLPGEAAATPGINTANLMQKMSESEMRVGMRSADFGDVSIRTMVSQQQMTAQISVDHSDLGKAISAHIPAMEAKIGGDLGLRALVQVNQSGMSFSGDRGFSSQREQRSTPQSTQNQNAPILAEADHSGMRTPILAATDGYRLDIRA